MDKKTYTLEQNGKSFEFSQSELTVKKDYKILQLLTSLDLNNVTVKSIKDINYSNIVKILTANQAIESFLKILLDPVSEDSKSFDFSEMTNSTLEVIITDFFDLNPTVKSRLKDSKANVVLQILIKMLENSESIAKT